MEDICCIFCSISSNQIAIEENGYYGRKCPICGLIYISPRPSSSEIQDLYVQDKSHGSAEAHISGTVKKRLHAKHNLRIVKKYINNGSLLEIGAGAGYFLDEAKKKGFDVHGIELNSIQAEFIRGKLGIPCEESPLNFSSFDGKRFDIIYHCDVISHFYDPIAEFKKMNNALVSNGILVFETGNLGDIKERYYRVHTMFQYPDHLFFFGESNLRELLRLTGFQLVGIYRYSILVQLWINKLLKGLIDFIKSKGENGNMDKNSKFHDTSKFSPKQLIRGAYHYFFYFIRYQVGSIMPKKGRPQTIIIIARKLTDALHEAE